MARRTRAESRMWDERIRVMFKTVEGSNLVENRYRALRYLLNKRYEKQTFTDREMTMNFIKDAVYLDRKMRLWTEGQQVELKKELSEDYQVEELGYGK